MDDPNSILDGPADSKCYWTTVNASEALPGVVTPLNWSWYDRPSERSNFGVFQAFGVLPTSYSVPFDNYELRSAGVFFGRYALNVDTWRFVSDLTPGSSGDAIEKQFFGSVREGIVAHQSKRRIGIVAIKLPWAVLTARTELMRVRESIGQWWKMRIAELPSVSLVRATEILAEAHRLFAEAQAIHLLCSIITQMVYQTLVQLADKAKLAGIETSLATGYGVEETQIQEDLWLLAKQGSGSLEAIIRQHGYTGPGEISRPSWREDPVQVSHLVERYRILPDDKRPSFVAMRQRAQREESEKRLLSALPLSSRAIAKVLIKLSRRYMPLRESGRAALLHGLDAGRAAAHVIGHQMVACGRLARLDDIFFLTLDEIRTLSRQQGATEAPNYIQSRRHRREYYLSIELPQAWTGRPVPIVSSARDAPPLSTETVLKGIGVTAKDAVGTARVIINPNESDDFIEGEILVCPVTDPSWASLFVIAAGVVIDVGGPLSHGAVVAREMGIPCVINTRNGTQRIKTGDKLKIDGANGIVEILRDEY